MWKMDTEGEVRIRKRFENAILLALMVEEGSSSQGIQTDSGIWKRPETDAPLKSLPSRRQAVLLTPRFNSEAHSGLVTSRTIK